MDFIDTHAHLDGPEFDDDRLAVMERAREAGCVAICVPAIDLASSQRILALWRKIPMRIKQTLKKHLLMGQKPPMKKPPQNKTPATTHREQVILMKMINPKI